VGIVGAASLGRTRWRLPVFGGGGGTPTPTPTALQVAPGAAPYTNAAPTAPNIQNTGSLAHYAQASGNASKIVVNYVDANNYIYLNAANGDGGFTVVYRNAGSESTVFGFTSVGGVGITSAMQRYFKVERLTSTSNRYSGFVGATTFTFTGGVLAIGNSTFAGIVAGTSVTGFETGPLATPLSISSTSFDAVVGTTLAVVINYTSTVAALVDYQIDGGTVAAATIIENATPGVATVGIPISARGTTPTITIITKKQSDGTQLGTASTSAEIPPATIMGINETGVARADVAGLGQWRNPSYVPIGLPGQLSSEIITASLDGSGATVKRDLDGGIYGTNGLGYSTYRYVVSVTPNAADYGTWVLEMAPGVTMASIGTDNITGGSYNSTTGIYSFTVSGAFYIDIALNCSSFTSTPIKVSLRKQGVPKYDATLDTRGIANINLVGKIIRDMDIVAAIGEGGYVYASTDTFTDSRTLANRTTAIGLYNIEEVVAIANAAGVRLWHNPRITDSDAYVQYEARYAAGVIDVSKKLVSAKPLVEPGNEWWNYGQNQVRLSHLLAVRAGLAPSALANNAAAVPETIIDCITRNQPTFAGGNATTTRAFADGDKFMIEASGHRVYQVTGAKASGSTFAFPAGGSGFTLLYNLADTDRAQLRFQGNTSKKKGDIWKAAWTESGRADAAPLTVIGAAAAQGFSAIQPALDWENNYLSINRVAIAPYYGEGVGGKYLAVYNDNSISGYGMADKDVLFTSTSAAGIAAFKTLYFSKSREAITAAIDTTSTFRNALGNYNVAKGLARHAIELVIYEMGWHCQFSTGGWPDRADAYNSANAYGTGSFVTWSDGAAYVASQAVPAGTTPANATYWTLKLSAAVVAEQRSAQLIESIKHDSRHGADYDFYLRGLAGVCGSEMMLYKRAGTGTWDIMDNEFDNTITGGTPNYRLKAVADLKTAIG
jgi:hypothetical protein